MKGLKAYFGIPHLAYLIFFISSIIVLWNLLLPKYIITLDMVFGPKINVQDMFYGFSTGFINGLPLYSLFYLLSFIVPTWLIQKLILFLILFLSGISAYKLCPAENQYGKLFAGILYTINPYTYVRFLAGHYLTLFGYAIAPFAIISFMDLLNDQKKENVIKASLLITITGILNLHYLFIISFVFLIFALFHVFTYINEAIKTIKSVLCVFMIFAILSIYWIVPYFTAAGDVILSQIGEGDIILYSSKSSIDFNAIFNVVSMHGFWRGGYDYAKYHIPYWYFLFAFILFLSVYGYLETNHKYKVPLLIALIISLFLAVGTVSPYFSGIYTWLFDNIFFFRGMREPHKFVWILALAYSFFGGIGVGNFAKSWKENKDKVSIIIVVLALLTPFVYSYTMLFGFNSWLKTVDYPQDWYEVNNFLNEDKEDFNILFLPWHMYMDFKWIPNADKRIANPASIFFDKKIIQGDNVEAGGIYSQSTNPFSKYIEFLLANHKRINNFGELMAPLNIKYILLTKEVDWGNYLWLKDQLELVKETENFLIFKNNYPTAKIYQVDELNIIKSWNELIDISKEEDVTSAVYVMGNETEIKKSSKETINYDKKSPVNFEIENPTKKYIIFTERYSDSWMLNRAKPIQNLGITNAFLAKEGSIKYTKFSLHLLCYLIPIAFILLMAFLKFFR